MAQPRIGQATLTTMGTRGYMAYRYKGKYYRQFIRGDAYPEFHGCSLMQSIPRKPALLEKWITKLSNVLLDKKALDEFFEWEEYDVCTNSSWTLADSYFEWTYVIDLDNRAFTVNGALHFKFDNLPPMRASGSKFGFADYFEETMEPLPEVPSEYLTSIDIWPKFKFDAEKDQQDYSALQPTVATLSEWNAPTWDTLSVTQHLSVSLIKTLVYDYSDELALCQYPSIWAKLGAFCWDVANAAATSHLLCPPTDASPQSDTTYVLDTTYPTYSTLPSPHIATHYCLQYKETIGRFCWFRGCLVTFCPRLDDPAYMTHKVVQMVQKLRKYGPAQGVGIIMSGWHVVAVTVDGSDVHHSPVLELHDGKEPKDGILLLMQLLSPTFTRSKAPWLAPVSPTPYDTRSTIPDDVLHQIIHFTDFETYIRLPMVSRRFRSICLVYPRIGYHTLLSYEGLSPNSEPIFRVRTTSSTDSKRAILKRVKVSIPDYKRAIPLWQYDFKHYNHRPIMEPGLAGMFQCLQTGTRPLDLVPALEIKPTTARASLKDVSFPDIFNRGKYRNLRVQILDGVWRMMEEGEELKVQSDGASDEED
ncbi:CHD5 domain protein, putative [Rhizoctonia solani AG-3 Rhs1AP]|uniref:CHD5 domain protein, putative n=2 Tax=Rhizoctonia solani AG-3 TaxID=1086053 RepID=X8IYE2_9AGAM|nr:CHD5 domain protein, putative [Rhizoctonia solani AG-3 Rhs1AP]KEP46925.1 putative CHD5 domain protein [Rhizoctonia solani 123E]